MVFSRRPPYRSHPDGCFAALRLRRLHWSTYEFYGSSQRRLSANVIGLFGAFRRDPQAPVDLASMALRVRAGFDVQASEGIGGALGRVAHPFDAGRGHSIDK